MKIVLAFVICAVVLTAARDATACACPRIYDPVCANNGRTFGNRCEFECEQKTRGGESLRIAHRGICSETLLELEDVDDVVLV